MTRRAGRVDCAARCLTAAMVLACLVTLFVTLPAWASGASDSFSLRGWGGTPIDVSLFVPDGADASTPVVIVMHGASRDLERYFRDWSGAAAENGFIAVVPWFPATDFPGSAAYNLGNVFDGNGDSRRPASEWTFAAIEPLFDAVVARIGGEQTGYTIYGHSAGAQFVHRFMYFVPDARATRYIAANAGWYTLPDRGTAFPYGLGGSGMTEEALRAALGKDLVVMLGQKDNDPNASKLRKTPEAEAQGAHRFERGHTMYATGKAEAAALGTPFGWRIVEVRDAGHSNARMTPGAAALVE